MSGGFYSGLGDGLHESELQRQQAEVARQQWRAYQQRYRFFPASATRYAQHCASCGAPFAAADSACSYCLTVKP